MTILPYPINQIFDLVAGQIYEFEYKLAKRPTTEQETAFKQTLAKRMPEVSLRDIKWDDRNLTYTISVKYIGQAGVVRELASTEVSKLILSYLKLSNIGVYEIKNIQEYTAIGKKVQQAIGTAKSVAEKVVPDISKVIGETLSGIWKPLHPILITIAIILALGLVAYFIFRKEIA